MFCSMCGKEIKITDRFCSNCGEKIKKPNSDVEFKQMPNNPKKGNKLVIILFIAVLITCLQIGFSVANSVEDVLSVFGVYTPKNTSLIYDIYAKIVGEINDNKTNDDNSIPKVNEYSQFYITTENGVTVIDDSYLSASYISFDVVTNQKCIVLEFNNEGTQIFADVTAENIGKPLNMYIDGTLISQPTVNSQITDGRTLIMGFDENTIEELNKAINKIISE